MIGRQAECEVSDAYPVSIHTTSQITVVRMTSWQEGSVKQLKGARTSTQSYILGRPFF